MARVKTAIITRKKHKKILKRAKGYYGAKHYRFRMAKQAVMKSGTYADVGSKATKSKVVGIQVSADEDMCYLTFSINFDSSEDADQFLVDFYKFKA